MIRVENLNLDLPDFSLREITFHVPAGAFFAIMGPTGSGKTLILESIAGLERRCRGSIIVDGRETIKLPPERRGISLVYQDHSLFPHLTVLQNVRYGQRYHGIDDKEGRLLAYSLLEQLGIDKQKDRKPTCLSGGEKQRVSLARALACKPRVMLLDEPLSSLDPQFREDLRNTLRDLHTEYAITFLMVTHDFIDALTLAHSAALVREGRIEQLGSVAEIFHQPKTPFTAGFVGMRNLFPAECRNDACRFAGLEVRGRLRNGASEAFAGIRPEDLIVEPGEKPDTWHVFNARVTRIAPHGFAFMVVAERNGHEFQAIANQHLVVDATLTPGREIRIGFEKSRLHVFPRQ